MASAVDNTYRVASSTWNAVAFEDTVGGSVRRSVEHTETAPGTRQVPLLALRKVRVFATVIFTGLATPRTLNTIANISFVLTKMGIVGGSKTLTVNNVRAADDDIDMGSEPHRQSSVFAHDPQGTEDLVPTSVA